MKKRFIKYICLALAFPLLSGCIGKFEDYNKNPYQPSKVQPSTLLTEMFKLYASAQQNSCQYNNTMWASFSGHVTETGKWGAGPGFYYYNAYDGFNDGSWGDYYPKVYTNLFQIEAMTGKEGVIYAVAQLTRVYMSHILLSLYGPIPYTQIKAGETMIPYDDEQTAWHALFDDLDEVIGILSSANAVNPDLKMVDQFYGGDCSKWMKFANTLKLRMAIRISGADPDYAKTMAEEAVASGVMETVGDSSWDTTNSGQPNGYNIVAGWPEVRANACLVSCMNGYEDPRRAEYFTEQKHTAAGGYVGVRHGSVEETLPASYANYSKMLCADDRSAPMPVMYAAEAAFLRAEGALKGWNMGGTAKEFYEKGIRLSFEEYGVSGSDAYIANDTLQPAAYEDILNNRVGDNHAPMSDITIKWADDGRELERVLMQKWIALYLDPLNGWSDFRRTGYPKIFLSTRSDDPTCSLSRGQRRLRFPRSEYNVNKANVDAAVQMLSNGQDTNGTELWWAQKN